VAKSMPKARLMNRDPNATWSGSLESYHPYLLPQKVSKNPKIY
jgi:hypothetical protein